MTIIVIFIDIVIGILPIAGARIVWWIEVNTINLSQCV